MPAARKQAPAIQPPPLETLGHGARMPTAEELEDEVRFNEARVAEANGWLNSPESSKRVTGAEQLSAYTTPESERILANALNLDNDPEVRKAAAQSLSAFKMPTDNTVLALTTALGDVNDEVQLSAMNTLVAVADKMEPHSQPRKKLNANLKKILSNRHLSALTKQAIKSFLKDQQTTNIFAPKP